MDDHEAGHEHDGPGAVSREMPAPIDLLKLAEKVQQLMREDVRLERARGALFERTRRT